MICNGGAHGTIKVVKSTSNITQNNKWYVLSVHWDINTKPVRKNSSLYINGKNIGNFKTHGYDVAGRQTSIGSSHVGIGANLLVGDVGHFMVFKSVKMSREEILLRHKVLIDRCGIDAD